MNQTNKPGINYGLVTTVVGFDIVSTVSVEGPDIREQVVRQVIKTQDEHVRRALIELGWTPPPADWQPAKYEQAEARMQREAQKFKAELVFPFDGIARSETKDKET